MCSALLKPFLFPIWGHFTVDIIKSLSLKDPVYAAASQTHIPSSDLSAEL